MENNKESIGRLNQDAFRDLRIEVTDFEISEEGVSFVLTNISAETIHYPGVTVVLKSRNI